MGPAYTRGYMKVRMGHSPTTRPHGLSAVSAQPPCIRPPPTSWLCRCSRLQNDKTGRVRQSVSHEPRIRSAPAEIRRVAGPPPPHPPSDCFLSQGVAMCRGSRTPTRKTRRVRRKRVPGRASDQRPLHQTHRRPATAAPVPGTRRSVNCPSPLPALVALRFQVHPTSSSLVSRQGPR